MIMTRPFVSADLLGQDPDAIAARRREIAARMEAVAKASEAQLPADQRRQVVDVLQGDALAVGGTVEHTAGPTWQQRAQIAAVLALGLPVAIAAAFIAARTITALAEWAGALFA